MAELVSKGPEAKVDKILGIDLRSSKSQLDQGKFDRFQGGYQAKTGSMTRMPGKELLRVFEDGTTPRAVLQEYQAFDGTDNIIVQNGDAVGVYSLGELLNRTTSFSLTPATFPAFAIMGNTQPYLSNGGQLGSSEGTFYPVTLTIQSNAPSVATEPGAIISCTNNIFSLALGIYRFRAKVLFGGGTIRNLVSARAGLYNVSNSQFQTYYGNSVEILSTSGRLGKYTTGNANGTLFLTGRFRVTAASENFAIYMAIASTPSGISGSAEAQGWQAAGVTSGSKPQRYSEINIYRE